MKSIQSWKTIRRLRGAVGSAVAVVIAGLAFGGEAGGLVGYYDMTGQGNVNQEPPILTAGETPVLLQDLMGSLHGLLGGARPGRARPSPYGSVSRVADPFSPALRVARDDADCP